MNRDDQEKFNAMMEEQERMKEEFLAAQPDGHEGEPIIIPTDADVSPGWFREKKPKTENSADNKSHSMVKDPSHYDIADTTVNDIIRKSFNHAEYMGWLKGNIMKYRLRAFKKDGPDKGMEDIKKADQYQQFYDDYRRENLP